MKGSKQMQKKAKISIILTLVIAAVVLVGMVAASVTYFGMQLQSATKEDEEIYFDHLYSISEKLINADRDFYQSMMGAMQYKSIAELPDDVPPEQVQELLDQYWSDYVDNKDQVIERVNESHSIASNEASLYTGTVLDTKNFDGCTFVLGHTYPVRKKSDKIIAIIQSGQRIVIRHVLQTLSLFPLFGGIVQTNDLFAGPPQIIIGYGHLYPKPLAALHPTFTAGALLGFPFRE